MTAGEAGRDDRVRVSVQHRALDEIQRARDKLELMVAEHRYVAERVQMQTMTREACIAWLNSLGHPPAEVEQKP